MGAGGWPARRRMPQRKPYFHNGRRFVNSLRCESARVWAGIGSHGRSVSGGGPTPRAVRYKRLELNAAAAMPGRRVDLAVETFFARRETRQWLVVAILLLCMIIVAGPTYSVYAVF